MTKLEQRIGRAISLGRWSMSSHAEDRCDERGVEPWQLVSGFAGGESISMDPQARPNPKIIRQQTLASGELAVVVWAYEQSARMAKLVTVYFQDR